ncbi:GrpB family protein [Bacillus tuaregi]|uniref:GrpB family protein n=1 Tax=Bacillus tuaregi TaxID=1816695 RepID=UPI0008F888D4|nr:GrpB family protein [Bacillus tuaregi]
MNNHKEQSNIPVWAYETIEIKAPDPMWKEKGIQEGATLYQILSDLGVKQVEHIGSTTIPKLPAKPIIDLMASIPSYKRIKEIVEKLALQD